MNDLDSIGKAKFDTSQKIVLGISKFTKRMVKAGVHGTCEDP